MVFDAVNQRALLFGGDSAIGGLSVHAELWAWQGQNWQLLGNGSSFAGSSYSAVSMLGDRVMIHGGLRTIPPLFSLVVGDTWMWHSGTWSQVATSGPSARRYHKMVETPQGLLLFGGQSATYSPLGDTWLYQLSGGWQQLTPTVSPSPRSRHQMVYDTSRGVVVLFGGWAITGLTDTWEWNGSTWTQRAPAHHPASPLAMAWSPTANRTIVHADGTWAWDGTDWQQLTIPAPVQPPPAMVHAPGGILGFGGGATASTLDETIQLIQSPLASLTPFGAGCPGPGGPIPTLAGAPGGAGPVLGTTLQMRIGNLPSGLSLPIMVLGSSNSMNTSPAYPLPADLGFVGFPGCQQLVSIDSMAATPNLTTTCDFPLAIPMQVGLLGFTVYGQGLVMYINGATAVSNALTIAVGV